MFTNLAIQRGPDNQIPFCDLVPGMTIVSSIQNLSTDSRFFSDFAMEKKNYTMDPAVAFQEVWLENWGTTLSESIWIYMLIYIYLPTNGWLGKSYQKMDDVCVYPKPLIWANSNNSLSQIWTNANLGMIPLK